MSRFSRCVLVVLLAATFVAAATAQAPVSYAGDSVVRVFLKSDADLATMLAISQDHWTEDVGVGVMEFRVTPEGLKALDATGIGYQVVLEDVGALIDAERQRLAGDEGGIAGGAWFNDYKTYAQVGTRLTELAALRPAIATTFTAGFSLEGRLIRGIRISGAAPGAPAVLLNGCQHAREWIAVMVPMYVADRLISDYDTDPVVQGLVDSLEFLIIPIVNPDGYEWTWGPDRLWRKNRRNNGNGTFGVDPNRNWDYQWGGGGSSGNPGDETYRGPFPFSEPETQVMRDLYVAHPQVISNIDFHSYSQLVLSPWGWTPSFPPDIDLFNSVGDQMAGAILSTHGETYIVGPANTTLYLADGVSVDWAYGARDVYSWTIELRPDTGNPGFILPPGEIVPTGEEAFAAVLELSQFSTSGPLFAFPNGLPPVVPAQETTDVVVQVTSILSTIEAGSELLHARVGAAGPFVESSLDATGPDTYEATLPAAPCGEEIQYYFSVETTDNSVWTSPPDAPASVHQALALESDVVFADDFQTDQGWTVTNTPALPDGPWDRGVPVNCDRGDPPADADGSGQCYLTDNSSANRCNSDVDGGGTTLTSPVMDASDPEAALSYWRWYSNDFGGDPFNDTFVVQVSDDGGATWVALETVGPAGPEVTGGWYLKQWPIANIAGIDPGLQFRVRFTASDNNPGSVIEAGVDGVTLQSAGCPKQVPGDIDGDGSVGITDLLLLLAAWGPCPGCPADLDGDGTAGINDLLILLANWG